MSEYSCLIKPQCPPAYSYLALVAPRLILCIIFIYLSLKNIWGLKERQWRRGKCAFVWPAIQQSHFSPALEGTVSAGWASRLRMLSVARVTFGAGAVAVVAVIYKVSVASSPSTFSHFDHVGSCGPLLHRSPAGSQAWGSALQSPRWIPSCPFA